MKKLDRALSEMCASHKWTLNGFNGNGEGEHKVMTYIRSLPAGTTCLVYGLDADLILLSMLNSFNNKTLYLMREEMEFNKVVSDAFLYLSICHLKNSYFENPSEKTVTDYIMMMSLLGNDFLPHSLSLTIKEGGHTVLFNLLKRFHSENRFLVADGNIVWGNLQAFIKEFMKDETYNIHDVCKKKSETRFFRINKQTASEYDLKMAAVYVTPCKWFVESAFWEAEKGLAPSWKETYYKQFLNKEKALVEYCKGLQWIMDYYLGKPVDFDWYYPWMYVPLWEDLYNYLQGDPIINFTYNDWIEPEQQLALVLPVKSYGLVQNPKYKKFPILYPEYFPTQFGFHSLGKKWFYECESAIPIFSSRYLRKILA
jgi:5'-3' exonuclease